MRDIDRSFELDLAREVLRRHDESGAGDIGAAELLSRALLQLDAELARVRPVVEAARAVTECVEHDIAIVTQHRNARQSGGQHVGTGGPLSAANPSMLVYLERLVRDMRRVLDKTAAIDEARDEGKQ